MPEAAQQALPGYGPDIEKSRERARAIMAAHGYGPDKRLKLKLSSRNLPTYRDAAVILIGQLKEIYIDAELETVETALWVPKLIRREYQLAVSQVGNGVDDPDQNYPENYACGSRTYMDYCNKDIDAKMDDALATGITDDAAANKKWADVDKAVTDTAAAAVLFTPKHVDFIAKRVGNFKFNAQYYWVIADSWVQ